MINFSRESWSDKAKGESINKGSPKFIKLAPSVIGIIVSLAVVIFVIWPKFNEIVKLRSENAHLDERAKALEDKVRILGVFSQKELEAKFVLAEKLIPSDKAVFSMITQVEKAASISGVILDKRDLVPGSASDQNAASGDSVVSATGVTGDTGSLGVDTPRIQIRVSIISDYLSL